jgi:hypothetical protein
MAGILLLLAACTASPRTMAGVVVAVEASDLTHLDAVTLRADDGRVQRFTVASEAVTAGHPASPSHLRQHMTYGDRVVIEYQDGAAGPVATRIDDAAP